MARLVLPLDEEERSRLARLSKATGLEVGVLLDLQRRGFAVVPADDPRAA